MRAVQNGWVPCTALARGLVAVQEQDPRELLLAGHCELESDTEAEAESDDPDLDGLDASDADSVQSDALSVASEPEGDVLDYQDPWILNVATGWFHRSVQCESADSSCMLQYDGRIIGKACRPSSALGDHYEVRLLDPGLDGFCACRHAPESAWPGVCTYALWARVSVPSNGLMSALSGKGEQRRVMVRVQMYYAVGPSLWVLWLALWALQLYVFASYLCASHFG